MSRDIYAVVDKTGRVVIPAIDRRILGIVSGSMITFTIDEVDLSSSTEETHE